MSFGAWRDDEDKHIVDDDPVKHHILASSSEHEQLSKTLTLDISDLIAHPERNTALLPESWKPDSMKQQQQRSSSPGSSSLRSPGAAARAGTRKFQAAAKFTVLMQKQRSPQSAAHRSPGGAGYAGSIHQPTHDDDLAAYIQSKEERKREKEAARQLAQDAHVPVHVKQMIHQEIRSRGTFKNRKQYGYTEPISLPLHRRKEFLARGDISNEKNAAGVPTTTSSARGGATGGNNNNFSPGQRSLAAATATTNRTASTMAPRSQKPDWDTSTTGPSAVTTTTKTRHRSAPPPATTSATGGTGAPLVSPPRHSKRRKSIDYIAALEEYSSHHHHHHHHSSSSHQHNNNSNAEQQRSRLQYGSSSPSPPGTSNNAVADGSGVDITAQTATTTTQYLNEIKAREMLALTAPLPPEAQKIVQQSVDNTQSQRDKVKAYREELDQLTLSADALRHEIAQGAPIARKYAQLQQVKTRVDAERRQKESRCKELDHMIQGMLKRLEKQEQRRKQQQLAQQQQQQQALASSSSLFASSSMFPSIHKPTSAAAALGASFFLTEGGEPQQQAQQQYNNNQQSSNSTATTQQVLELHRRVDELSLKRDMMVKERDRRLRAASAAFENRQARLAPLQHARRTASLSAPPRSKINNGRSHDIRGSSHSRGKRNNNAAPEDDEDAPPPKPIEPNDREKQWIADQAAALKRSLAHDLDKEVQQLTVDHERALKHRRRDFERKLDLIIKDQNAMQQKLSGLVAVGEQACAMTAEQKLAQAALDSQVAEKQQQLKALVEQRRASEERLKRVVQQTSSAKSQLERLQQELLVAENVPVQKHVDEDARRAKVRSDITQQVSALKTEEKQISKRSGELEKQRKEVDAETQQIEAHPAAKDQQVLIAEQSVRDAEAKQRAEAKAAEMAQHRLLAARQRLSFARQNKLANEAQDAEIAQLTQALEQRKAKLRHENSRNLELLEKLDRAERLLSMMGGSSNTGNAHGSSSKR